MEQINIFVGTDRSQKLAVTVLEHSIRRHTDANINLIALDNDIAGIPMPDNIHHGPRTGFSFTRYAIPALMEFKGKALYLDADMLVFKDIQELWNREFAGHHILIVGDTENTRFKGILGRRRPRQCSVMLIDCEKCHWDVTEIVNGLGRDYSYEQLMYEVCILSDQEIGAVLPFRWNSLEYKDENTCLLHYTDMQVQPWVEPSNPLAYLWVNELRMMLDENSLTLDRIREEIDAGHLRPSLYDEVQLPIQNTSSPRKIIEQYHQYDEEKGFVRHKEINNERKSRAKKIKEIENNMTLSELLKLMPSRESKHPILRAKYYYYLLTH